MWTRTLPGWAALAGTLIASPSFAGGNVTYLVPAFARCPGPDTCAPTRRESRFTFETAILRTPRGRYVNPKKPAFVLSLRGVRDETGAPVTGDGFTIQVMSGQVNLGGGDPVSLPAGFPLAQVPPIPIALRNGSGSQPYTPSGLPPAGTIVEGGLVEVYDSDSHRLATTGTQYR